MNRQPMDLLLLPKSLSGPAAWLGLDMTRNEDRWLYRLSAAEIADLEHAARHYLSLNRDVGEISAADFPLSSFASHLKALKNKLLRKRMGNTC